MFRAPLAFAFAALLAPRLAAAAGFGIAWQAPEACGTEQAFEAGVARVVGKSLAELDSPWKSASVVITEQQGAWRLRVGVTSEAGAHRERDVRASSCRDAVEAAELIVATSLTAAPSPAESVLGTDESAAEAQPAARAEKPKTEPSAPATKPRAASEATQDSSPRRSGPRAETLAWTFGARAGLEPWLLPSVTPFGALVLGLETAQLRGELALQATYPERNSFAGGGGAKAELFAADLLGCAGEHAARFFIWGCLGGEAGAFHVAGESGGMLVHEHSQTEPWLAGLAQIELGRELGAGFALGLGGTGMATSRRVRVLESAAQSGEIVELYSTRRASLRPFLELSGRFR